MFVRVSGSAKTKTKIFLDRAHLKFNNLTGIMVDYIFLHMSQKYNTKIIKVNNTQHY